MAESPEPCEPADPVLPDLEQPVAEVPEPHEPVDPVLPDGVELQPPARKFQEPATQQFHYRLAQENYQTQHYVMKLLLKQRIAQLDVQPAPQQDSIQTLTEIPDQQ